MLVPKPMPPPILVAPMLGWELAWELAGAMIPRWHPQEWPEELCTYMATHPRKEAIEELTWEVRTWALASELQALSATHLLPQ